MLAAEDVLLLLSFVVAGLSAAREIDLGAAAGDGVDESLRSLSDALLCLLTGDGPISRPKATPERNSSPRRDSACQRRTTEEALMRP